MFFREHFARPLPVRWAGFVSDTYTLQHCGWELCASQNAERDELTLAIRHPRYQMEGLSRPVSFRERMFYPELGRDHRAEIELVMARELHLHGTFPLMSPIDATPQMVDMAPRGLAEFAYFAPLQPRLLLPEATCGDLLDRILKMQQPIREEAVRRDVKLKHSIGII